MNKRNIASERLELANRLRQIRENAGYTQESFAVLMELTVSAYKKIESAENQMTLDGLRRLNKKLRVSADYLLFGKNADLEETWKMIQNCTDSHKLCLMLRLMSYFTQTKGSVYMEKKTLQQWDDTIGEVMDLLDRR